MNQSKRAELACPKCGGQLGDDWAVCAQCGHVFWVRIGNALAVALALVTIGVFACDPEGWRWVWIVLGYLVGFLALDQARLACRKSATCPQCQGRLGTDRVCRQCGHTLWLHIGGGLVLALALVAVGVFACNPGGWRWAWIVPGGLISVPALDDIRLALTKPWRPREPRRPLGAGGIILVASLIVFGVFFLFSVIGAEAYYDNGFRVQHLKYPIIISMVAGGFAAARTH